LLGFPFGLCPHSKNVKFKGFFGFFPKEGKSKEQSREERIAASLAIY